MLRSETAEHTAWGTESEEKVLGTLQDYAYKGTLTTPEEDALGGHAYWPHSVSACVYWGARVCDARGELLGVSSFTRCTARLCLLAVSLVLPTFHSEATCPTWLPSP